MSQYGVKRDYSKIEIFIGAHYVATTTWANGLKQAKEKYIEAYPHLIGWITVRYPI